MRDIFKYILTFLLMFTFWEKTYNIAAGQVKIRIDYDLTHSVFDLNFDVIDIGKLKYGFEDDDALTFYPNTLELTFEDAERKYYDVLKFSLGEFGNNYPLNYLKYGGVTLWLNGKIKFKGYIDPLTLEYIDDNRTTSFECIDVSKALRDMSVENVFGDDYQHNLGYLISAIYKKIYPELSYLVYDHPNFSNGLYFKHDWRFTGYRTGTDHITRDWSNISDFILTKFYFSSFGFWGENRPADTYADLIKLLALQFGLIIGTTDYNKVFAVKRFSPYTSSFINLDANLKNNFKKYIHLPQIAGVRNTNTWTYLPTVQRRIYTAGFVETINSQGDLRYKNIVKEIATSIASDTTLLGSFTAISVQENYPVYSDIYDPALNIRNHIAQLISYWTYLTRIRPKDKIECELYGIDYAMFNFYEITNPGNPTLRFRPMTIEIDLLNNKTNMSGVEI